MSALETPPAERATGNFVAEWFGHRVWQVVDDSRQAMRNQGGRLCPFLTTATEQATLCVKRARGWTEPYGVCTISSDSNGTRQDWVACPYRTLDQHFTLLASAVQAAYEIPASASILLLPLTVLRREDQRRRIIEAVAAATRVFLFSSQKLGERSTSRRPTRRPARRLIFRSSRSGKLTTAASRSRSATIFSTRFRLPISTEVRSMRRHCCGTSARPAQRRSLP